MQGTHKTVSMLRSGHEIVIQFTEDVSWHYYDGREQTDRDGIDSAGPLRKEFQKNGEVVNRKVSSEKEIVNDTDHYDWDLVKHD